MRTAAASSEQDRELVDRYLEARAESAFRDLYRAHTPYLFGLALRICGGRRDDAEEALQEAWIRAAGKLGEFRWSSALRTWLGGFVVNCCRERLRKRPPGRELSLVEEPDLGPVAEESGAGQTQVEDRLDLDRLLAELPEGQRIVLVLYAVEGYTHAEISGLLGIAPGTSKSRLFEARRSLRRLRDEHRQFGETS